MLRRDSHSSTWDHVDIVLWEYAFPYVRQWILYYENMHSHMSDSEYCTMRICIPILSDSEYCIMRICIPKCPTVNIVLWEYAFPYCLTVNIVLWEYAFPYVRQWILYYENMHSHMSDIEYCTMRICITICPTLNIVLWVYAPRVCMKVANILLWDYSNVLARPYTVQ